MAGGYNYVAVTQLVVMTHDFKWLWLVVVVGISYVSKLWRCVW